MKNKLKIAFVLLSFGTTMLTMYAANRSNASRPAVGVDVSRFSPNMLSISSRVAGSQTEITPVAHDTVTNGSDSLSIETTNN